MHSTNSMSAEGASLSSGVPVIGFNWLQAQVRNEKGHIINNLLTLSVRSLQGNLRPRP